MSEFTIGDVFAKFNKQPSHSPGLQTQSRGVETFAGKSELIPLVNQLNKHESSTRLKAVSAIGQKVIELVAASETRSAYVPLSIGFVVREVFSAYLLVFDDQSLDIELIAFLQSVLLNSQYDVRRLVPPEVIRRDILPKLMCAMHTEDKLVRKAATRAFDSVFGSGKYEACYELVHETIMSRISQGERNLCSMMALLLSVPGVSLVRDVNAVIAWILELPVLESRREEFLHAIARGIRSSGSRPGSASCTKLISALDHDGGRVSRIPEAEWASVADIEYLVDCLEAPQSNSILLKPSNAPLPTWFHSASLIQRLGLSKECVVRRVVAPWAAGNSSWVLLVLDLAACYSGADKCTVLEWMVRTCVAGQIRVCCGSVERLLQELSKRSLLASSSELQASFSSLSVSVGHPLALTFVVLRLSPGTTHEVEELVSQTSAAQNSGPVEALHLLATLGSVIYTPADGGRLCLPSAFALSGLLDKCFPPKPAMSLRRDSRCNDDDYLAFAVGWTLYYLWRHEENPTMMAERIHRITRHLVALGNRAMPNFLVMSIDFVLSCTFSFVAALIPDEGLSGQVVKNRRYLESLVAYRPGETMSDIFHQHKAAAEHFRAAEHLRSLAPLGSGSASSNLSNGIVLLRDAVEKCPDLFLMNSPDLESWCVPVPGVSVLDAEPDTVSRLRSNWLDAFASRMCDSLESYVLEEGRLPRGLSCQRLSLRFVVLITSIRDRTF